METINKQTYKELIAGDGMYITTYKDTDEIKDFSAFKRSVCPLTKDISDYKEISESQYQELIKKQEEYFKFLQ